MRVLVPRIACTAAALALAGCRESAGPREPQQFSYAIFNADVSADGSGGFTTAPVGFFFRAPALPLPSSQGDLELCVTQQLLPPGDELPLFIDAGDSVAFAAEGSSTVYLKPEEGTEIVAYRVPGESPPPVPVTAGATVTFTVPGAPDGFPASNIAIKTAEPYEISSLPEEIPAGQDITVTWTPAGSGGSRMDLAFMYATAQGAGLNTQFICSVRDDGQYTVQAADLVAFRAAAGGVRRFTSRRWRSAFKDLGDSSVMLALSSYVAPAQDWP